MDWVNSLREILGFPLIVSLLTVIATLYVSYKLSMRRERTLKIVERHSDDLRDLAKRWTKEVPDIEFVGSPLTKKPTVLEAPVEHEYLFEDLKKHIPADMKLLEAWQQFKEDYNQFNENRFSLFQEIVKNLKEKLKLPYTPKWGRHGFSNHFVTAIYKDIFKIVRNLRPDGLTMEARIERIARGPDICEFWVANSGFASGTEQEMKEAERVWKEVLSELSSSRHTKQAEQMFQQYETLVKSRNTLVRKINDFISIPIFPGKCKYIKWASG